MSEGEESSKQIDRVLIIDESSFTSNLTRDIYKALLHFLLLADNADPSYRTPRLGVTLLQGNGRHILPKILFPFQPLNKSTLVKLRSALKQSSASVYNSVGDTAHLDYLHWKNVLAESVKSQLQPIITAHHDSSIGCEFILTVITGRDRMWVDKSLRLLNSLSTIRNILVRKIEIVCAANVDNCLEDSSMDMDGHDTIPIPNRLSDENTRNNSISQSMTESSFGAEISIGSLSVVADEVSLLQYFKSWLTFQNNDSEDVRLHIGQLTLKCDIQDCVLRTDWMPFQNSFYINEIQSQSEGNTNKTCGALRQQHFSIELNSVSLIEEKGVCESVLFGTPRLLKPTSFWKLDWEDLEKNQERFLALSEKLSERKQCLVVKQSCNLDVRGRRVPNGHFLLLPSATCNGMLIKPIVTRELVIESGCETGITRDIDKYVQQEVSSTLDSLSLYGEYNPLNHESGLYTCLENLYEKGKTAGSAQRSTGSVRSERGYVGAIPPRKGVIRGRKKIAFVQSVNSDEYGRNMTSSRIQTHNHNPNHSHDLCLSPASDY